MRSKSASESQYRRWHVFAAGSIFLATALVVGLWTGSDQNKGNSSSRADVHAATNRKISEVGKAVGSEMRGGGVASDQADVSDGRHAITFSKPRRADGQPLLLRAKPVEPAAVLAVLGNGEQTVDERVTQLRGMRGISLSTEERESAMAFLAGEQVPEDMGKGSMHWLADELLTVLRMQEPAWSGLTDELGKVAFRAETDPVVRDYIMQHLGHLWEQYGASREIDDMLWRAIESSDETTPGTALIALSRGYERDEQKNNLRKVRQRALALAHDAGMSLAVRVTALAIAGDAGGKEVRALSEALVQDTEAPLILRRVAERILK